MPELEPIVCTQCGAPLQMPAGVGFATCNHCHAALAVKREAGVTYTERLDVLEDRTDLMVGQLAELREQEGVELLEKAWARERAELMIRWKDGRERVPDANEAVRLRMRAGLLCLVVLIGIVIAVPGLAWFWIPFYLVVLVLLWLSARQEIHLAEKYKAAEARFVQRRRELTNTTLTE